MSSSNAGDDNVGSSRRQRASLLHPQRVLSAVERPGFSMFIIAGAVDLGLKMLVTAASQRGEALAIPDLHT